MEIADIFVVNKADREGADRTVASIEAMLSLQSFADGHWRPPIVKTEATTRQGRRRAVETDRALPRARRRHARRASPRARRVARARADGASFRAARARPGARRRRVRAMLDRIAARETDPYTVVDDIMARTRRRSAAESERHDHDEGDRSITSASRSPISMPLALLSRRAGPRGRGRRGRARPSACARTSSARGERSRRWSCSRRTADDSPIAKYLAKRGPGLHHITLRVDDIRAALAHLKARASG